MLKNLLIEKCNIYTRSGSVSQFGNPVIVYTLLASDIRCRSGHVNNKFGGYAGEVNAISTHFLYLDENYVLDTTNRIALNGVTYQINHADAKYDGRKVHHNYYELTAVESPQSGEKV